jgi:3-isopropylmalate/(R)-2-methylmalate dehydratase small subunit
VRVWKLGADIDTDVLAPGAYMKLDIAGIAGHCLESVLPKFAAQVKPGDVVVAGANFGIGSSREQAASVLVHLGVSAVIAPSYSGLYFRNAFNVGLLLLTCSEVDAIADADSVTLIEGKGGMGYRVQLSDGRELICSVIPDFLLAMVRAGGLLNQLKIDLKRNEKND